MILYILKVAQLSQALQSVSSVVFQSGIMTSGMDFIHSGQYRIPYNTNIY